MAAFVKKAVHQASESSLDTSKPQILLYQQDNRFDLIEPSGPSHPADNSAPLSSKYYVPSPLQVKIKFTASFSTCTHRFLKLYEVL